MWYQSMKCTREWNLKFGDELICYFWNLVLSLLPNHVNIQFCFYLKNPRNLEILWHDFHSISFGRLSYIWNFGLCIFMSVIKFPMVLAYLYCFMWSTCLLILQCPEVINSGCSCLYEEKYYGGEIDEPWRLFICVGWFKIVWCPMLEAAFVCIVALGYKTCNSRHMNVLHSL